MLRSIFAPFALAMFVLNAAPASSPFVTFNDSVMNFAFSYPDRFQALPPVQPQLGGCLTIPLRLKGKLERTYERILVNEIDYECLKRDTPEIGSLTKSTEKDLMNVYGELEMSEPTKFLLDGHPAAFIRAKAKVLAPMKGLDAGMVLYGAQTCAVFDHRVACWNVLSSDQASFGSLMTGKVGINGHPGVAWVPKM
jgi:hypothetical protein